MKERRLFLAVLFCVFAAGPLLKAQTLASGSPPKYPLAARAAGIDGPVTLKGIVSAQGKMQNVRVLSGPPELRQAAVDAVMSWTYKPYTHFGQPVEVETTVTVNFNMGKGKEKDAAQAKAQAELADSSKPPPQEVPPQPPPKQ